MKKITSCILLFNMILELTVFASDLPITIINNTVKVEYTTDKNVIGSIIVVKSGADLSNNDNIYAVKQASSNEEGIVEFVFNMPDSYDAEGDYDLYIKCGDNDIEKNFMTYVTHEHKIAIFDDIKKMISEENCSGLVDIFDKSENNSVLKVLGFSMSDYSKLINDNNKENVFKICIDNLKTIPDYDDDTIISTLNSGLLIELINTSDVANITVYLDGLNPHNGETNYKKLDDVIKNFVNRIIYANRPYVSRDSVNRFFTVAKALYEINNSRFSDLTAVLKNNAGNLEINTNETYIDYLSGTTDRTKTNENIVLKLKDSPVETVDDLLDVISDSIVSKKNSSGGGGGTNSKNKVTNVSIPNNISIAESNIAKADTFTDVSDVKWAETAINYLSKNNIMVGDGQGKFRPNDYVTREEFAKIIVMAANLYSDNKKCDFNDVSEDDWFYKYVASASSLNIISGFDNGLFGTGRNISRQDMAVICCRSLELINKKEYSAAELNFDDVNLISDYAVDSVSKMKTENIITGDNFNKFNPLGNATRAEAAVIVYRAFFN